MGIFKAYDIRGRYPDEIDEKKAYTIGRAFVAFTKAKDVMVGHDARTHSPSLSDALIRGLTDQGANVTHAGLATTPQVISMHIKKGHDCAIMVTASHLDAPMNGFKMYTQGGKNITAYYGMAEIEALVRTEQFPAPKHPGTVKSVDYTAEYAHEVEKHAPHASGKHKRFVVDCSNGSSGPEVLLHKGTLALDIDVINEQPDGTFPNHSPNPISPGAEKQAVERILATHAAGGCIFDADADRITFLDEQGKPIHPNAISCLIISELLRTRPGRTIAYDLISSRVVPETILHAHGKPLRTRVGRNILVDDMRREHALFGAESSSHMIYGDLYYADAASLSMLIVFDIVERSGKPFSALAQPIMKYPIQQERNYHVEQQQKTMDAIGEFFPSGKQDHLDGLALTFPDGWIVVRPSNTEPLLRLRAEANTKERLAELVAGVERVVLEFGGSLAHDSH